MDDLQFGREAMAAAECKIRNALKSSTPFDAIRITMLEFEAITDVREQLAFVSVLASRLAISEICDSLSATSQMPETSA
jgi:hypothetical protein